MVFGRIGSTIVALAAGLAAVLATGEGRADNFLLRGFTWFGFLEGKELREGCFPGAPDRLRFVYNGVYQEQIRVYEAIRGGPGAPGTLHARILTKLNLANFRLSEIFLGTRDIEATATLDPAAFETLVQIAFADGFGQPVPDGLALPSDGFYWIVSGCVGGQWHIQGWTHPTPRFEALRFPARLFAFDRTGVAVNRPRAIDAGERMRARSGNQSKLDTQPAFDVRLSDSGVVGRMPGL